MGGIEPPSQGPQPRILTTILMPPYFKDEESLEQTELIGEYSKMLRIFGYQKPLVFEYKIDYKKLVHKTDYKNFR